MDDFDDAPLSSIFPFLSVLCCVIGTMILILVAGSLQAANIGGSDPTVARDIAVSQREVTKLSDLRGERDLSLQRRKDEIEVAKAFSSGISDLGALRERQASLERNIDHTVARMSVFKTTTASILSIPRKRDLIVERSEAEGARASALDESAASRTHLLEAEAERDELAATVDALKTQSVASISSIAVSGEGDDLSPVIVDLHAGSINMPDGSVLGIAAAASEGGPLDRLAMEIARPGSGVFALLIVRPGAVEAFNVSSAAFVRRRAPFKAEPLEDGREIALGEDEQDG